MCVTFGDIVMRADGNINTLSLMKILTQEAGNPVQNNAQKE